MRRQPEPAGPVVPAVHPGKSFSETPSHATPVNESYCTTCKKKSYYQLTARRASSTAARHPLGKCAQEDGSRVFEGFSPVAATTVRFRPPSIRLRPRPRPGSAPAYGRSTGRSPPLPAAPGRAEPRREDSVAPRPHARARQSMRDVAGGRHPEAAARAGGYVARGAAAVCGGGRRQLLRR